MELGRVDFTPTEQRLLDTLRDGKSHSVTELMTCLDDPVATSKNLRDHIHNLRKKLEKKAHSIQADRRGTPTTKITVHYRIVRIIG